MQHASSTALLDERHQWLLERLAAEGTLLTQPVAAELDVSVDTVRRDLRHLHDRGLLRRVHGGAVRLSPLAPSFSGRAGDDSTERVKLASGIVSRLRAGQVIGLDAGTTTTEIARQIPQSLEVTIVTNNPAAAVALADHRSATVIVLGGHVDLRWMATTGPATVDAIRGFHLDLAVIGACSFDVAAGATTRAQQQAATKQAFMSAAVETIMPVESSKLSTVSPFHVAAPTDVEVMVVAGAAISALEKDYRIAGVQLTTT